MTPVPRQASPSTGNAPSLGFPRPSRDRDDFGLLKMPAQAANRTPTGPFQVEKSYNPNNNYFDNIAFEDASAFFDFEPHSRTITPTTKHGLQSKTSFDFGGNGWDSFQPLSPPDSAVYPSEDWRHFDQPQVPHNILTQIDQSRARAQFGQTTPPDEDLSSSLEYQLGPQQHGLPSPDSLSSGSGTNRKSSAVDKTATSTPPKRVRKSAARSSKHGDWADPNDPDGNRRSKFLERNRIAASKCRQKKKEWTSNLENRARDLQRQNNELRLTVDSCKEEILFLKGEMLKHTACGCSTIQEYLQSGANAFVDQHDAVVKRETSPEATLPTSPGLGPSAQNDEHSTPPSDSDQSSPSRQPTVEENLEALLQPHCAHDRSDKGIARQVGG